MTLYGHCKYIGNALRRGVFPKYPQNNLLYPHNSNWQGKVELPYLSYETGPSSLISVTAYLSQKFRDYVPYSLDFTVTSLQFHGKILTGFFKPIFAQCALPCVLYDKVQMIQLKLK